MSSSSRKQSNFQLKSSREQSLFGKKANVYPNSSNKEQLKDFFMRYDTNLDGRLSRQELRDAFSSLGAGTSSWRAWRVLKYADSNTDGFLDDEELDRLVNYAHRVGYIANKTGGASGSLLATEEGDKVEDEFDGLVKYVKKSGFSVVH